MRAEGYSGNVEFDGRTVKIDRQGTIGAAMVGGRGVKAIPIQSIVSVQFKTPRLFTNGYIQFDTAAQDSTQIMLKGTTAGNVNLNQVFFLGGALAQFEALRASVEGAMDQVANKDSTVPAGISSLDTLKKLKELLDMGAISQDEFDSKKSQLMDEM